MISCVFGLAPGLAFAEATDLREVGKTALEGARLSRNFSDLNYFNKSKKKPSS
jgi:hypothetical protein